MFFRKLLGNNESKTDKLSGPPAGMQTMGANLQRRFARGIQYNMKIIIKGDRNVGKTCLFQRLQGHKFKEEYIPTEEIQVASIMWNYKATDDIVKVEVWDVVDKGKKKKKKDGLKMDNSVEGMYDDTCLDAEFVDVYKGTQGVIMVMDITKQWTFDYVQREIRNVPANMPVLLLANHRDMGHHRTYTEDQVRVFISELERPEGAAQIRYAETSMRNGFGLKYIHKFFNLPFLQLQRETLLKQLETNTQEIETTNQELALHEESEDQDYDLFLDGLTNKRREQAELLAEKALSDAKRTQEQERAAAAIAAASQKKTTSAPTTPVAPPSAQLREAPPAKPIPGLDMSTIVPKVATTSSVTTTTVSNQPVSMATNSKSAPSTPTASTEKTGSLMSRLFGGKNKTKTLDVPASVPEPTKTTMPSVHSIDDFIVEEALDASFLEDTKEVDTGKSRQQDAESSSEDERNPMVAQFQDDIDSEDEVNDSAPAKNSKVFSTAVELSSDDESEAENNPSVIVPLQPTKLDHKNSSKSKNSDTSNHSGHKLMNKNESRKKSRSPSPKLTSSNVFSSEQYSHHLKPENLSNRKQTLKELSQTRQAKPKVMQNGDLDESDESDDESTNQITVLQDIEDISEDETTSSSRPTDSVVTDDVMATDDVTTDDVMATDDIKTDDVAPNDFMDNEESSPSDSKQSLGLEFEDLSVLEKGFSFSTGMPRVESASSEFILSSSRADSDTEQEINSSTKKKKKHKTKDRDREKDGERSHKKHKNKKPRERTSEHPETDDAKLRKKKKKKKEEDICINDDNDDLEAFLGPSTGDGAYESI